MKNKYVNRLFENIKKNHVQIVLGLIIIILNFLTLGNLQFTSGNNFTANNSKIIFALILFFEVVMFVLISFFIKKNKPIEKVFLLISIPLGLLYMSLIPMGRVPDERNHFLRAYEISEGYLISDKNEKNGNGGRTLSDDTSKIFEAKNKKSTYGDLIENSKIKKSNRKSFKNFTNMSLYSFVCYIPQVIGISIGKILHLPTLYIAYLGRLTNFVFWILLMYFAIKLMPFKKICILVVSFMPMMLQEAASLSADALTIGMSFFLISYVLHIKYGKEKVDRKDKIILSISSIVMSLCKIVYLPICLVLFLIPFSKFKSKKDKYMNIISLAIIVVFINLFWLKISSSYLIEFNAGVSSIDQVKFILMHPVDYIKIFYQSLYNNITLYVYNIIGFSLCYFDVNLSYLYIFMYLFMIIIVFVLDNTKKIDKWDKWMQAFIIVSTVALMFTSLYVQWTPVGASIIDGVQGRYFIPLLLPIMILTNFKGIESFKNKDNFITVVSYLIILMNVYSLMIIYFNHL